MRRLRARFTDRGVSMVELLVAVVLLVIAGSFAVKAYANQNRATVVSTARSNATSQLQDASTALTRDVADAQVITTADSAKLQLFVIRADVCNQRTYAIVGGKLQVTTDFYAQASCAGPTTTKTVTLVDSFTPTAPFSYIDTNLVQLTTPVSEIRGITAVQWHLARDVTGMTNGVSRDAAQPYEGKNMAAGNGQQAARALAPLLSVTTNNTGMEGRDAPQLTWVDNSPSVTAGWNIFRAAWPEGGTQAAWTLLTTIGDPTVLTYTDMALPAGYTAQYTVQPRVAGGTETPQSNVVTTGLRPATTTGVTATGQPTAIKVNWAQAIGATDYDLYRDGALLAHTGNVLSYVDGTGYGHSHTYQLVAWNRWEALVLGGTQTAQATIGDATTKTYRSGTARNVSTSAGAYTAPAAPTVTLTANSDWSNTVAWTAAPWTGTGPTTIGGVNRDRGWTGDVNGSNTTTPSGTWTALWGGAEAAPSTPSRIDAYTQAAVAGQWRTYRVTTCNPIGCSPTSTVQNVLQRPVNPGACTAALGSIPTRQVTVTVARPAQVAPYDNTEVTGGAPAAGYGVAGTGQANQTTWAIDQLAHSTGQTFTVRNHNASPANGGWSDTNSCSTTTAVLGVTTPSVSSSTRAISATSTATNGTSQNITLEGVQTLPNTLNGYWDPLPQSTGYTVTSRNSDGVNGVMAQAAISTQTLSVGTPNCYATITTSVAPGAITVGGGDQVKLGFGGTVYGGPRSFTGLSAGTYYGYARDTNTDGYNTSYSGWDTCGAASIIGPPQTPGSFSTATVLKIMDSGTNQFKGLEFQVTFSAVPNATKYEVKYAWSNNGGPTSMVISSSPWVYDDLNNTDIISSAQVYYRAGNSAGWSGWYGPVTLTPSGQVSF